MNIKKNKTHTKRRYAKPRIEKVLVDKKITMVMMTTPPGDPDDISISPDQFLNNPFKLNKY